MTLTGDQKKRKGKRYSKEFLKELKIDAIALALEQ